MQCRILAYLLTSVVVLGVSSNDIYLSSLPEMAEDFLVDADWVNLTLSIFNIGMAIGSLIVGFISDYYGRRRIYVGALFIYAFLAGLIVIAPWLKLIIILRFFQGASVSVFAVVSLQIIGDICDSTERVRFTGLISTGAVISPAIAPVIGAYIAHYTSWRMCFAFSAVFALVLFILLRKFLSETIKQRVALPKPKSLLKEYAVYFHSRQFIGFSLVITFFYGAYFAFINMSSFIYIEELYFDPRWYAKIFLLLAFAYLFGNSMMQKLHKRGMTKKFIVGCGLIVSVIGTIVSFMIYTSKQQLMLGLIITVSAVIMRAGYALLLSPAQIIVMEAGDWREGTAAGLLYFMQFVFGAFASVIISGFHETPLLSTVWGMAILLVLAIISFFIGCSGKKKDKKHCKDC